MKNFVNNKNIVANIFIIQAYVSVMCGYFCIGFIDYMYMGKSLTDYNYLFSPNNFKMVEINSIESIEHNSIDSSNLNN